MNKLPAVRDPRAAPAFTRHPKAACLPQPPVTILIPDIDHRTGGYP